MRNQKEANKHKKDRCEACGNNWPMLDVDHIKTVGSGGSNGSHNCMTLCRICHIEKGSKGIKFMASKYPSYNNFLVANGWSLCKLRGKYIHEKEN